MFLVRLLVRFTHFTGCPFYIVLRCFVFCYFGAVQIKRPFPLKSQFDFVFVSFLQFASNADLLWNADFRNLVTVA